MFEKFGEFDSCEEINESAEGLFNEGDVESLKTLAKENGIPEEIVKMYMEGDVPELCDAEMAAVGKIDIEVKDLKPQEIMVDWIEYLKVQVMSGDEELARNVRKKGKSLKGMIAALLKWSFGHQQKIDQDITKAAGVNARVTLGIPGMGRAKKIIREYYGGYYGSEEDYSDYGGIIRNHAGNARKLERRVHEERAGNSNLLQNQRQLCRLHLRKMWA